jgi:PTS system cellobiose-specific IIC component
VTPISDSIASLSVGRRVALRMTAFAETPIMAAVRAGVVAVVPLTIVGGVFMLLANPPIPAVEAWVTPFSAILSIPVAATFGLLALFVCLAVAYDLGERRGQDRLSSVILAGSSFLLLAVEPDTGRLSPDPLASQGILTAILVAIAAVEVQAFFTRRNLVIRMPDGVPKVIYESFASLVPLTVLLASFWAIRFLLGVDLTATVQWLFTPLIFALNTLPGICVYAFLVTLLWSIGINGDNALDAVVAPVFLQYLAANVEAWEAGTTPPYSTALGFFTSFVNVGGTGATIALALVLFNCRDPGTRRISRLSLPTQVFQINEPLFFGLPIVLNPVLMVPYVLNSFLLTATSFLLMEWGLVGRPVVGIPWTTPPIIGHYLVTGGDWRAAVWGAVSIGLAMVVYWPFARAWLRAKEHASEANSGGAAGEPGVSDVA